MTLVEGEELQRLWALVSELSSQLSANRQLCHSLQAQADELKGQALHTGTGYTLRRFNLDISKEKFESELEKLNSQLVLENQSLSHENKQMNLLLREYENTLESVMSKFRSFSHASQQHTLSLTSHYETMLANDLHRAESMSLHSSTNFSDSLAKLGSLVRLVWRELEGEGVEPGDGDEGRDADPFEADGYRVGSPSGIGPSQQDEASSSRHSGGKKTKLGYGSAPSRDPRWYGTGGYTGPQGDPEAEKAERALQAMTEEERLRRENEALREMLRVSADITPEVAREFGVEIPAAWSNWSNTGLDSSRLSLGKARGSRKSVADSTFNSSDNATRTEARSEAKASLEARKRETERLSGQDEATSSGAAEPMSLSPPPTSSLFGEWKEPNPLPEVGPLSPEKVVPSHLAEGSGGSPQLAIGSEAEGETKDTGVIVTSQSDTGGDAGATEGLGLTEDQNACIGLGLEEMGVGGWAVEATNGSMPAQGAKGGEETARERLLDEAEEKLAETLEETPGGA